MRIRGFIVDRIIDDWSWNDLHDWILSIETGDSKWGRKLIVSEINIYQMNTGGFV
ncbi:hypothetical protein [Bacillus mycoides]|uniref:hypothetical protein n=1 Tax=Bacillus mycoides TaxID=1405 RepID=UPI001642E905|nr:hypothetical protein [Bacillus mycoides]